MFIHTCSHNHQYCQPLPHCRPVSSHSQGSIISPLLKKPTLNKEELFNYRPISNLSLISKILECVVKSGFMDHLTSNSLLNSHQSAYCKTSFYRNSSFVRPRSPRQCNRITKSITPLLTRPICCFRHYWPWHLDHLSLILVLYPLLCTQLVQVISVIWHNVIVIKEICHPSVNKISSYLSNQGGS